MFVYATVSIAPMVTHADSVLLPVTKHSPVNPGHVGHELGVLTITTKKKNKQKKTKKKKKQPDGYPIPL